LKNPANGKTMMHEFKTLWEKGVRERKTHEMIM
jgi:hypothetical protein